MIAHKTKASMPGRLSHNALLKHRQITRLAAGGQTLCVSITDLQINCVRLAYGHHNPLKLLQTVNLHSAQNSLKPLSQLNYREMREPANPWIISTSTNGGGWSNPLNRLDYNDSLELDKSLIIPKTCDAGSMMPFLNHEENQQSTVLDDDANPQHLKNRHAADLQDAGHESDLVYERVVPHSYQVNRIAKRYADSQNSLRGEPLHNSLRVMQNSPFLRGAVHSITESNPVQPFGSMPRLSNSLRSSRLIQPDLLSSPSSFIAIASRSDSSLSSLSCTTWRSLFSFVDIVNSCDLVCSGVDNVLHCMTSSKAKPAGATNTNGPLTKPLSEVTVMADQQHTQTRPKYTWRFLALNRLDKKAKPCRLSVEAATEREARRILAPHFILSLAARLPAAEVNHG